MYNKDKLFTALRSSYRAPFVTLVAAWEQIKVRAPRDFGCCTSMGNKSASNEGVFSPEKASSGEILGDPEELNEPSRINTNNCLVNGQRSNFCMQNCRKEGNSLSIHCEKIKIFYYYYY